MKRLYKISAIRRKQIAILKRAKKNKDRIIKKLDRGAVLKATKENISVCYLSTNNNPNLAQSVYFVTTERSGQMFLKKGNVVLCEFTERSSSSIERFCVESLDGNLYSVVKKKAGKVVFLDGIPTDARKKNDIPIGSYFFPVEFNQMIVSASKKLDVSGICAMYVDVKDKLGTYDKSTLQLYTEKGMRVDSSQNIFDSNDKKLTKEEAEIPDGFFKQVLDNKYPDFAISVFLGDDNSNPDNYKDKAKAMQAPDGKVVLVTNAGRNLAKPKLK